MSDLECLGYSLSLQFERSIMEHHQEVNERLHRRALEVCGFPEESYKNVKSVSQESHIPASIEKPIRTKVTVHFMNGAILTHFTTDSLLS